MIVSPMSAVSFRDPGGFMFRENDRLFRQVNQVSRDHYDHLMESGLYDALVGSNLLVRHEESGAPPLNPALAYKVIEPERVDLISYPYEWSFSQFKDAALLTLAVQREAVRRGMSLKDCSAYNVQFHEGRPIFIDTLSLEIYREGEPWVPYRQFCQHFLAPLALMSLTDVRLNQLCRTNIDGVPLDLAARLLPRASRLRFGISLHIHLHAFMQRYSAGHGQGRNGGADGRRFSRTALLGLVDSLEATVNRLRWRPRRSEWVSYYRENTYSQRSLGHKERLVAEFLDQVGPERVWDLGANTGHFSRLASDRGILTTAFDLDPACVEANYQQVKERRETKLLPLLLDLLNPSPASGWINHERASIFNRGRPDLVLALALIHHLAITGNLPLENLAEFFAGIAPSLVIEFVPPDDPQVQRLLARRRGVHHPYDQVHFEQCFQRYFSIRTARTIEAQGRTLYLMIRRGEDGYGAG